MPDNDVTYTAIFVAGTANYTVKHYQQNTDGSTYPTTPTETETKSGTTGQQTNATAKSYTGFTAGTITQATIAADGSTVVSIYYTRDTYTINYNAGSYGSGTSSSATKYYGVDLTLPSTAMFTRSGYVQTGWSTSQYGTSKAYDLGGTYSANSGTTLYPYWQQLTSYTVTWKVNGATYNTGGPSTSVYDGSQVTTLPTAPSISGCSEMTFVGWSTTNIGSTPTTTAPTTFTTAAASPTITENTIFYAVFAVGNTTGSASFVPNDFYGQGTSNTGSPVSATKDGVTLACDKGYCYGTSHVRCYSGGTLTISSENTITAISFTFSGGSYTGGMSTSYTGLSTNNWTRTLNSQARITGVTVTVQRKYVTEKVQYTITAISSDSSQGTVSVQQQ